MRRRRLTAVAAVILSLAMCFPFMAYAEETAGFKDKEYVIDEKAAEKDYKSTQQMLENAYYGMLQEVGNEDNYKDLGPKGVYYVFYRAFSFFNQYFGLICIIVGAVGAFLIFAFKKNKALRKRGWILVFSIIVLCILRITAGRLLFPSKY